MYPISVLQNDDDISLLRGGVFVPSPGIKWTFVSTSTNRVGETMFCDFQARS